MKNNNYQISITILCLNYIIKYDCKEKTINYSGKNWLIVIPVVSYENTCFTLLDCGRVTTNVDSKTFW